MSDGGECAHPGAHTLPLYRNSFVGRTGELVRLGADLARHRLVTLSGPGGTGKSRLAAEVADHAAALYPDGVWWVDLAPLSAPGQVWGAVLGALGLPDAGEWPPARHLESCLRCRRALIVLDNCEHLLTGCADMAAEAVSACAGLGVLATSREPLGAPGELVREVPALDLPSPEPEPGAAHGSRSGSERLFLDRARELRPDLVLDGAAEAVVAEICLDLEGVPLALELAATQAGEMTVNQIRTGLADGARLLEIGSTGRTGRHASLEACIRWSHDLLSAAEQLLLRRLSVFAGSFCADDAAAVCADASLSARAVPELLDSLTRRSLLGVDRPNFGSAQYRMPVTIRQFAAVQLAAAGEVVELHGRHLRNAVVTAAAAEQALLGATGRVVAELGRRLDDQRHALERALVTSDLEPALELAAPLAFHLVHHGRYGEARDAAARALARPGGSAASRGRVCWALALSCWYLADLEATRNAAEQCKRLAADSNDVGLRGRAHLALAWCADGDPRAARALLTEALRCAEAAGDTWVLMDTPSEFGVLAMRADDHPAAIGLFSRAVDLACHHGNDYLLAVGLFGLSVSHLRRGELAAARAASTEAGERARGVGERAGSAYADYVLGSTELAAGRADVAAEVSERGLRACAEAGTDLARAALLALRARAAIERGGAQAIEELAAALAAGNAEVHPWEYAPAALALARGHAATGELVRAGAGLDVVAAVADRLDSPWVRASVLVLRGLLSLDADPADAARHAQDALRAAAAHGFALLAVDALDVLALAELLRGRAVEGVRLRAAADARRAALGYPRPVADRPWQHRTEAALSAAALDDEEVTRARAEGRHLTVDQVIARRDRGRGPRGHPSGGWAGLTRAERDVAALAAEGLSNAAIAGRLVIAPGTVKTHLSRIYGKLGVANRTELAAAVHRNPAPPHPATTPGPGSAGRGA